MTNVLMAAGCCLALWVGLSVFLFVHLIGNAWLAEKVDKANSTMLN